MDKNDFDIDFDFEKEYGFDPDLFLSEDDDDMDLDAFLNGDNQETEAPEAPAVEEEAAPEAPVTEEEPEEEEEEPEEDLAADFPMHASAPRVAGTTEEEEPQEYADEDEDDEEEYDDDDGEVYDEDGEAPRKARKKLDLSGVKMPQINIPKIQLPNVKDWAIVAAVAHLVDLYLEPLKKVSDESADLDPLDPRVIRRKKREKKRIFKEVYLPAIIAGVALFVIISFFVGAGANAVRAAKLKNEQQKQEAAQQLLEDQAAEARYAEVMAEADRLAAGYDYDAADELLKSFASSTNKFQKEINEKLTSLVAARGELAEITDTSEIPNLSFHVLIADPARAFNKNVAGDLAGSYNKNFVTTAEFEKILNQLYTANYVLVDFDSFIDCQTGVDGNETFHPHSIHLPQGKKPVMITETMVNYFQYMVDVNKDGTPDAGGHGFANKLVVDANGDIKAAYIDENGNSLVGNYDLVPILEDFIKEHPDFSYQGARAILAVTGDEGIFGYRCNTSFVQSVGQDFYDEQVVGAKQIVQALRDKGYTLASYTYSNAKYKDLSTLQIQAEMQNWANQVKPVLGDVNVMVFARASDIDGYSGTSFDALYAAGFRYFLNNGSSPRVDANTTFVRQTRLMVTGEAMAWYSNQFSKYFDCNVILDMSVRGNGPAKS